MLALVSGLGCSRRNIAAPASVHGKVTYHAQPVPAGHVFFHPTSGTGFTSMLLDKEGEYAGRDLPLGEYVVTFETESANPSASHGGNARMQASRYTKELGDMNKLMMEHMGRHDSPAAAKEPKGAYVKIPKRYTDQKTSPHNATLGPGDQKKDFELTD
jgi:hypothetical protein